jgi:hypothetical protein
MPGLLLMVASGKGASFRLLSRRLLVIATAWGILNGAVYANGGRITFLPLATLIGYVLILLLILGLEYRKSKT